MLLNNYQLSALSTAIYPDSASIFYPALGLAGEYGELLEMMIVRNDDHKLVQMEIGDLLWYIAVLANDLQATLTEVLGSVDCMAMDFDELESWSLKVYSNRDPYDYVGIMISSTCELIKKLYRDDAGILTSERRKNLLVNLAWLLMGVCELAGSWNLSLDVIAKLNIRKLASRKERDVLRGDGDDR